MSEFQMSRFVPAVAVLLLAACAATQPAIPVSRESVAPGTSVTRRGAPVRLLGTAVAVGSALPATDLVDSDTLQRVDLARERGKVLFLSVIVSIDTGL